MRVNPFMKLRIVCRLSIDQARSRLAMFTLQPPTIKHFWRFASMPKPRKTDRYVGTISADRFTVMARPRTELGRTLEMQRHSMVIIGRFKHTQSGCEVTVRLRPTLNAMFSWIVFPIITLVLASNVIPELAYGHAMLGAVFCFLLAVVLVRRHMKGMMEEAQFMTELFEAEQSGATANTVSHFVPVGR